MNFPVYTLEYIGSTLLILERIDIVEENKMGVMPMKKLILNMALPMILSMLIGALYNVVDSLFVSRFSEDALSAVSLAFPVQNIIIAIGT
jgi:Na+-driven multidrug efflux pump